MVISDTASLTFVFRMAIGLLFAFAAIDKAFAPERFTLALRRYRRMPVGLGPLVRRGLPPIELMIAVLLISGIEWRAAACIATLLSLAFIAFLLEVRQTADCGCGRLMSVLSWRGHVASNAALFVIALNLATADQTRFAPGPQSILGAHTLAPISWLASIAIAILLVAIALLSDRVWTARHELRNRLARVGSLAAAHRKREVWDARQQMQIGGTTNAKEN